MAKVKIESDPKIKELPASAMAELAASSNGISWEPDSADGRTLFDTPSSEDNSILVVFPQNRFDKWRAQALAHIISNDGRTYLGQVTKGPYAAPNGLPATSPLLVATQIEGTLFTPPFHGWVELTILGEVKEGQTLSPLNRPRPNSQVRLLSLEDNKDRPCLRWRCPVGQGCRLSGPVCGTAEQRKTPRSTPHAGSRHNRSRQVDLHGEPHRKTVLGGLLCSRHRR